MESDISLFNFNASQEKNEVKNSIANQKKIFFTSKLPNNYIDMFIVL